MFDLPLKYQLWCSNSISPVFLGTRKHRLTPRAAKEENVQVGTGKGEEVYKRPWGGSNRRLNTWRFVIKEREKDLRIIEELERETGSLGVSVCRAILCALLRFLLDSFLCFLTTR